MTPAAAVLAAALALASAAAPVHADVPSAADQVLDLGNRLREREGVEPLQVDARLSRAALQFARHMADTDRYGHDADGRDPATRVEAAGYRWCLVAENIAWQYSSEGYDATTLARRLMAGWERSPPHRRNLLDPRAVQTGIATALSAGSGRHYAVQLFARPCRNAE